MNENTHMSGELSDLVRLNSELARLLNTPPAAITFGSDAAAMDSLVICGLLGGKDVGKSTLINALANARVSKDEAEVGRGTDRAVAYVHASAQDALADRLRALDRHVPVEIVTHTAEAIRNAALVDLPDFDSEFLDHLRIVRAVAPLLDRILWVLTPRKVGDRAWAALVDEVVKDGSNVRFVLNKVDELITDADALNGEADPARDGAAAAQAFWRRHRRWFTDSTASTPPVSALQDCFLVAAAYPTTVQFTKRVAHVWDDPGFQRYSGEQNAVRAIAQLMEDDVKRLRAAILDSVDDVRGRRIKDANRRTELAIGAQRIQAAYDLERIAAQLAHAVDPDYAGELLDESFPPNYRDKVAGVVRTMLPSDRQLADEWLERRVDQWPLLRIVYWPFGWAARLAGRGLRLRGGTGERSQQDRSVKGGPKSLLDVAAPPPVERIELMRARLLADHSVVAARFAWDRDVPKPDTLADRLAQGSRSLPEQIHERLLEEMRGKERHPSIFGRAALWLILIWFPFLQPVTAGALEIVGEGGAWHTARGMLRIVSVFSATHLLAGFAVVAVVFLTLIAGMYARRLRAVRRWRGEHEATLIANAVDELFVNELIAPLTHPVHSARIRLDGLMARLPKTDNGTV
jgi:hypothetical protein